MYTFFNFRSQKTIKMHASMKPVDIKIVLFFFEVFLGNIRVLPIWYHRGVGSSTIRYSIGHLQRSTSKINHTYRL